MSHFKYHILICSHLKPSGKGCCPQFPAEDAISFLKEKTKALGITGVGKTRVSQAGCLGRCTKRPVMVIYPQAIWYRYESYDDLQEIIDSHLLKNTIVERLKIEDAT